MPRPTPVDLPLHWFQILLSLADEPRHGLGITKDVFDRTRGRTHLWPGMLYGALKQLSAARLVDETDAPSSFESGGGRPRFYRLTAAGRQACAAEARRLEHLVDAAREKGMLKKPRPG